MEDIHVIVDDIAAKKKEICVCNAELEATNKKMQMQIGIEGKVGVLNAKKNSYNKIKKEYDDLLNTLDKDEELYMEELAENMNNYKKKIDNITSELAFMGWRPNWEFNYDIKDKLIQLNQDKINLQAELDDLVTKEKHAAYSLQRTSSGTGNPPSSGTPEDELEKIFNKIISGGRVLDDGIVSFKDWETGMRTYFEQIKALKLMN